MDNDRTNLILDLEEKCQEIHKILEEVKTWNFDYAIGSIQDRLDELITRIEDYRTELSCK